MSFVRLHHSGEASFPDCLLRGIRESEWIVLGPDGTLYVLGKALEPHWATAKARVEQRKKSNHYETSINWDEYLTESFRTLCDDTKNAKHGVLVFRLAALEEVRRRDSTAARGLSWERDPIKSNRFHGNLL